MCQFPTRRWERVDSPVWEKEPPRVEQGWWPQQQGDGSYMGYPNLPPHSRSSTPSTQGGYGAEKRKSTSQMGSDTGNLGNHNSEFGSRPVSGMSNHSTERESNFRTNPTHNVLMQVIARSPHQYGVTHDHPGLGRVH